MATKYTNPISITSARRIEVQQPSDDRGQFDTIADVIASIVADDHYRWFEYMLTYVFEVHQICAWLDEANLPAGVDGDDLIPGTATVYPGGFPDAQYAGKTFGLYSLRAIPVAHSHVEADITDLDKYTQAEVDAFLAAKQNSLPGNATGQVAYLTKNAADDTFSWVVLTFLTAPVNTGHGYHYNNGWIISQDPVSEPIAASSVPLPDKKLLQIPVQMHLQGGETYTLENPANLPDAYSVVFTHSNLPVLDDITINGYAIDDVVIPFILGHNESIWVGVIDGTWRRLDNKNK